MDSEELLALMISMPAPAPNPGNWDSVLMIYSRHLERLAPKLDEQDLGALIASGAMFYRTLCVVDAARIQAVERWDGTPPSEPK